MGQYGCDAFLSSVAEISSTKTLFFRIPVLLSDLLCFLFNWIFHYGSNLGVEMGRIPLLGQDPVQVLVFWTKMKLDLKMLCNRQRWNVVDIVQFVPLFAIPGSEVLYTSAVVEQCCTCCTGTRSWTGGCELVPVLKEVFKIYPIFPFKRKVIHEFAMISSLGALLHVLSFVLVSGLQPERCAAFWVIKEEAAEIWSSSPCFPRVLAAGV